MSLQVPFSDIKDGHLSVDEKELDSSDEKPHSSHRQSVKSSRSGSKSGRQKRLAKGSPKGRKGKKHDAGVAKDISALPEDVYPITILNQTQKLFNCVIDQDVTVESPTKLLKRDEILEDIKKRGAVSDFHPFKQKIQDYHTEEILFVCDLEFKYGENFLVALTNEAKEKLLQILEDVDSEDEEVCYIYVPPKSKPWVSLGSEKEVKDQIVVEKRKKIKMTATRIRKEFGAYKEFTDRGPNDVKDGYLECSPYVDAGFDLKRIELDKAIQAVPQITMMGMQTDWKQPRNAKTQYYPREFSEEELRKIGESKSLKDFIEDVTVRFEVALQQNEIMNVFFDEWQHLIDNFNATEGQAENPMKEYQSFADLKYSKDKCITCIQWHPTLKSIIGTSVAENVTFDERLDKNSKLILSPSLILLWSFADPIHPQLLLEAPEDIHSFQFSPSDPNIIAGGCANGQVVLWDITAYADRLKQIKGRGKKKTVYLPGFEDESFFRIPMIYYSAVSNIEFSHHGTITDIQWLPDHMEISRIGVPVENTALDCCQLMTCATDHCVLFWDVRPPKVSNIDESKRRQSSVISSVGISNTFRHLDLVWKPLLRVMLTKAEPGGDHSPTKFSIFEVQGNRKALSDLEAVVLDQSIVTTMYSVHKSGTAAKERRPLQEVTTMFYIGTEDGEIVYAEWMPQKDVDSGKFLTPKPEYYHTVHSGPVVSLCRSPFFRDILLSVGGWTFAIWKEGTSAGAILQSCTAVSRLVDGQWSPSRPGVIYLARKDGNMEVWDLLDKTHEASMIQNITPMPITTVSLYQVSIKQQLVAVGDVTGTLRILEVSANLMKPSTNELQGVANYFDREVKRRSFVQKRWRFREMERREHELQKKAAAGIAPAVQQSEEELDYKALHEYHDYLDDEHNLLRQLGMRADPEEVLVES